MTCVLNIRYLRSIVLPAYLSYYSSNIFHSASANRKLSRSAMTPLRLKRVVGLDGRENDILFLPAALKPTQTSEQHQTLVFFGGDVQDYPEIMAAHRDNAKYLNWNLEQTARMLAQDFPQKNILIVRPSRIELKTFSCYDNFVESNNAGVPEYAPNHGALLHLHRLLESVTNRLQSMTTSSGHDDEASSSTRDDLVPEKKAVERSLDLQLEHSLLSLVGFSKGCVVLNQLVHEFHHTLSHKPPDEVLTRFISYTESMYWLDGGHAGGANTWLTQRALLQTLANTGVTIYVHVSPYQVHDESRPWIGREEKIFTSLLTKLGAKVSRYLHDSTEPNSLHTHFSVLSNFKRVQDSDTAAPSHHS